VGYGIYRLVKKPPTNITPTPTPVTPGGTTPTSAIKYTVTTAVYPANAGSIKLNNTTATTGSFNAGSNVTLFAIPNANWTFNKWTGGPTGTNQTSFVLNRNMTITAEFDVLSQAGGGTPIPDNLPPEETMNPPAGTNWWLPPLGGTEFADFYSWFLQHMGYSCYDLGINKDNYKTFGKTYYDQYLSYINATNGTQDIPMTDPWYVPGAVAYDPSGNVPTLPNIVGPESPNPGAVTVDPVTGEVTPVPGAGTPETGYTYIISPRIYLRNSPNTQGYYAGEGSAMARIVKKTSFAFLGIAVVKDWQYCDKDGYVTWSYLSMDAGDYTVEAQFKGSRTDAGIGKVNFTVEPLTYRIDGGYTWTKDVIVTDFAIPTEYIPWDPGPLPPLGGTEWADFSLWFLETYGFAATYAGIDEATYQDSEYYPQYLERKSQVGPGHYEYLY
jgi:hypothetical protein